MSKIAGIRIFRVRQLYEMKGVKVTAVVAHYMKCIGIVVAADPLRSMEKLSLYFSVLSWWTNSMFLTHSSPLFFVAWHLYWIERLCLFCNTAPSTVLRKVTKETQKCQKHRKLLDVSLAGEQVDCGCHSSIVYCWHFCVSSVYFWFAKGDVKYGEGLPSICSVQLSEMWMGYGGAVCSLVIMFCVNCAENNIVILMIAKGNDSHVSVLPV